MIIEKERSESDETEEHAYEGEPEGVVVVQGQPSLSPEESLRLQLLIISKDILLGKAAMRWETHKQYGDVSVSEIIDEAKKMFDFVRDPDES